MIVLRPARACQEDSGRLVELVGSPGSRGTSAAGDILMGQLRVPQLRFGNRLSPSSSLASDPQTGRVTRSLILAAECSSAGPWNEADQKKHIWALAAARRHALRFDISVTRRWHTDVTRPRGPANG